MIFITLGSQKFQFNRLLKRVDELIDSGVIKDEVFAQVGASDYTPRNFQYTQFMDREAFAAKMDECSAVITHGGTGVIIGAVKKGKKVIAVPRLAKFGEHVDDHQLQLLHQFDELGIILVCYDTDKLDEVYNSMFTTELKPYVSNTQVILDSIGEFIQSVDKKEK